MPPASQIKTASECARTLQEQADMLGVHERRLRQLIAELGTEHDIGKRLGRQRKP